MTATIDLVQVSALVGAVLPLVAALLKQDHFSKRVNSLIALVVAIGAAVVTVAARGQLDLDDLGASFATIYSVAVAFFHGLWNPSGLEPALQTATSSQPRRSDPTRDARESAVDRELEPAAAFAVTIPPPTGPVDPADVTAADRPVGGWPFEA